MNKRCSLCKNEISVELDSCLHKHCGKIIEVFHKETGEAERDDQFIKDWLHAVYCEDCLYATEEYGGCEIKSLFQCDIILDDFR